VLLLALVFCPAASAAETAALPPAAQKKVSFRQDVYPLLAARCFKCHQGASASSGHRLDLRPELLGEGNGKPLVQPGNSGGSRLIQMVAGVVPGKVMPPRGERLSAEQVGLLRAWIDQGVDWDEALLPSRARSTHWAYQPVSNPPVPRVKNAAWVSNPIDAFIAARHEAAGLTAAPEAPPRTLVRRLYLDLTGLPPAPAEVDAFLADRAPGAYERLVERLLASPHYGERWGRHWLDLARWAESEGYESNHLRPYAWRYRDYVVDSFNRDKPYARFVTEQLAGDELLPYSDQNLIATGFLAAARFSSNEEDRARQRNDVLVDVVNATGATFLGLTVNCAQCHNHKFDAVTARDYYRLQAFFVQGQPANLALKDRALWADYEAKRPPEADAARKLLDALIDKAKTDLSAKARKELPPDQLAAWDTPADRRTPKQEELARQAALKFNPGNTCVELAIPPEDRKLFDELRKKVEAMEKRGPDKPQTLGFYSPVSSPTRVDVLPMRGFYPLPFEPAELARIHSWLLVGGDAHRVGPRAEAGWPAVFGPTPKAVGERPSRRALADWVTSPRNPLAARVWVNRLWQYHFGKGLVATPSDFGVKGAPPTHPELLDWLAGELLRGGGSAKHLHRLIVCSRTYRQSSAPHAGNGRIDPDNKLLWRWPTRRLEAEAVRDAMLAVSGELDRRVGGPSAAPDGKSVRRTLYLFQKREGRPEVQGLFDGPSAAAESCPQRAVSTVPLQALYLLNNDFVYRRGHAFARRVLAQGGADRGRQVEAAFLLALGRAPDIDERADAAAFFRGHASDGFAPPRPPEGGEGPGVRGESAQRQAAPLTPNPSPPKRGRGEQERPPTAGEPSQALVDFCQALLNVNEFVYLE
jgi:cytochrome c553